MSFVDDVIVRIPEPLRGLAFRHHELIKFAIVGGITMVIDMAIFFSLKLTVLDTKPTVAKIIAGVIAVIASYVLNREWSFKNRGGRERHHEALLFFLVSGIGAGLAAAPVWISNNVLDLKEPNVSFFAENAADFAAGFIIGNLLQMIFRFWAMRRFVFPEESPPAIEMIPDPAEEELGHS